MSKVRLMDIIIDPNIQVREVEPYTVGHYAQAMKIGAKFPPLILEKKTNRCVCGNHRYFAYKRAFEPETLVPVTFREFANEAEIIRLAATDNSHHGKPLDTWDMKRVVIRLRDLGDTVEDVAKILSVPVKKIEKWAGLTVVVIGKNKTKYSAPVKHGLEHLAGRTVTVAEYNLHKAHDYGNSVKNMAAIITRHINNGWIDIEDTKTMDNLVVLHDAISGLIIEEGKAVGI